jgi:hypothetical protein
MVLAGIGYKRNIDSEAPLHKEAAITTQSIITHAYVNDLLTKSLRYHRLHGRAPSSAISSRSRRSSPCRPLIACASAAQTALLEQPGLCYPWIGSRNGLGRRWGGLNAGRRGDAEFAGPSRRGCGRVVAHRANPPLLHGSAGGFANIKIARCDFFRSRIDRYVGIGKSAVILLCRRSFFLKQSDPTPSRGPACRQCDQKLFPTNGQKAIRQPQTRTSHINLTPPRCINASPRPGDPRGIPSQATAGSRPLGGIYPLILASSVIGHHFSISALCSIVNDSEPCCSRGRIYWAESARRDRTAESASAAATAEPSLATMVFGLPFGAQTAVQA